jgi:hypothetical protein
MKWPPAPVAARTLTRAYSMHGVGIAIEAGDPALINRLDRRLAPFRVVDGDVYAALRFEFQASDAAADFEALPPAERTVYEVAGVEFRYSQGRDQLQVLRHGRPLAVCNPGGGEARFRVGEGGADDLELYSQTLFTICLLELMKPLGRFGLHAAGVSLDGAGLLIAGPSGVGKSTLAVLLLQALRSRAGFLGDDMLFLRQGSGEIVVLGWPEAINVGGWTRRMVSGLESRVHEAASNGRKENISAAAISGASPAFEAVPAVIVLPRLTGRDRSTITPMSRDEALFELAPNVLLTESASSGAHLALLASLARSCPCYRLDAGSDLDRLPHLLLGLM